MARDHHIDDLLAVREGDDVSFTTTGDLAASVECVEKERQSADPRTGEVRDTTIWTFEQGDTTLYASIVDGLKSSENDPDFPVSSEVYDPDAETSHGYINTLQIHGDLE